MAVRLNVVMIQNPPAAVGGQHLAESTIGEVIGLPGIDLLLVNSLAEIDRRSTDFLSLESLQSDVAVLGWEHQASIAEQWNGLGLVGTRSRHQNDPDADVARSSRRLFAFNLTQFSGGKAVCSALKQLLQTQQTKTFTIGLGGNVSSAKTETTPVMIQPTTDSTGQRDVPRSNSNQQHSDADLDQLLDELDSMDP